MFDAVVLLAVWGTDVCLVRLMPFDSKDTVVVLPFVRFSSPSLLLSCSGDLGMFSANVTEHCNLCCCCSLNNSSSEYAAFLIKLLELSVCVSVTMECVVAIPLTDEGVEIADTGGVSGACMEPVVVVEAVDVPSDVCREGGAVNPPETCRSGKALALLHCLWLQKNLLWNSLLSSTGEVPLYIL